MKRTKLMRFVTFMGIVVVLLSGCGAKSDRDMGSTNNTAYDSEVQYAGERYTSTSDSKQSISPSENEDAVGDSVQITNTSALTSDETIINSQDKIIRRFSLVIESMDFDNLITTIDTQITQLGGYIESSDISGRRFYHSENMRYGNMIARVPKDKVNGFIFTVKDIANVVNSQQSTDNVTLAYVDTQSHKKALEIEQERLLALLEKVETLEDIITLESRLSSVRYELQSYESQLRTYDNLVEYSTVTLNIQEVERMSLASEDKTTVWKRIQTGFGDSLYHIGEGLKNFVVWFLVNLPYLLLWAMVITIVVIIVKIINKKAKIKYNPQQESIVKNQDKNHKNDE